MKQASRKLNRPVPTLTEADVRPLEGYDWPGNVRELQNVIERAVITSHGSTLHFDLPATGGDGSPPPPPTVATAASTEQEDHDVLPDAEFRRRERDNILAALRKTNWRIYGSGGAAELLGVKATTLSSRIRKLGLKKPGSQASSGQ